MDRNKLMFCKCVRQVVALRKESVDRNLYHEPDNIRSAGSLSARRAWIEISRPSGTLRWTTVALRKESVDRKGTMTARCAGLTWSLSARRAWIEIITAAANTWKMWRSLSARRAWIEIFPPYCSPQNKRVALRKESVDRNWISCMLVPILLGRSPQGERG